MTDKCVSHSYRTRLHDFLDSRDFYELCQNYRHVNQRLYQSEEKTVEAFEALKAAILEQAIGADYVPPTGPSGEEKQDTEILDWLQKQSNGMLWIARESTTGRGYRVHTDPHMGMFTDVRAAILSAIRRDEAKSRLAATTGGNK